MKPNDSSVELQPVFDTVCQLYSSKIAADLQADSSHIRRQTLPEFMYSTYLFQTGEPSAAKHALTEFISLVYYFETVSSFKRVRCELIKFILLWFDPLSGSTQTPHLWKVSLECTRYPAVHTSLFRSPLTPVYSGHSFDALNIFLAALSFCNFDRTPIIGADTVFVDSSRIRPCCEYIFHNVKQAKKEEICMEAKTKFATRHVNMDGNQIYWIVLLNFFLMCYYMAKLF
jgi:hypothetical protein